MSNRARGFAAWIALGCAGVVHGACVDNVVLVHGNSGSPSDFANTTSTLLARGYAGAQIFKPAWGSACAACNDHNGSEETPVEDAMIDAIASSCTGRIDVIGHSMGGTLAARVIDRVGLKSYVDGFVGIAARSADCAAAVPTRGTCGRARVVPGDCRCRARSSMASAASVSARGCFR